MVWTLQYVQKHSIEFKEMCSKILEKKLIVDSFLSICVTTYKEKRFLITSYDITILFEHINQTAFNVSMWFI